MHVPWLTGAFTVVLVAVVARTIYLDASYGYVPITDSAGYLEAALQIAAGHGARTLVGYPIAATSDPLMPNLFHPAGSLLPYVVAGLATGSDRVAAGLAVALLLYLITVSICYAMIARLTGSILTGVFVSGAYALDARVLSEASGVLTTIPFALVIAAVCGLCLGAWPPSRRRLALVGVGLAIAHSIRATEVPLVVALVAVLAADRRWQDIGWTLGPYGAALILLSPLGVVSPAHTAILLAGIPEFQGFSPAQLEVPRLGDALVQHWPAIARKTLSNVGANLQLLPAFGNPYLTVLGVAVAVGGMLRGDRRLAVVTLGLAGTILFTSAAVVGGQYFLHLLVLLYVIAGISIAMRPYKQGIALAAIAGGVSLMLLATDVRELYRQRPQAADQAMAMLRSATEIQKHVGEAETVISDTPTIPALYARRRAYLMPLQLADLPKLEQRIGGARLIMLSARQTFDVVAYPDDAWRQAYASNRIYDFELIATIGEGRAGIRLYRQN